MTDKELKQKEVMFNTLIYWLNEYHFELGKKEKNGVDNKIQFRVNCSTRDPQKWPFNVAFVKEFSQSFFINSMIGLQEKDYHIFKGIVKKERMKVIMDIKKLVYPFGVSCSIELPRILLYRILTTESVRNNKQYFIDEVYKIVHCVELASIRFEELFYDIYPEGKKINNDLG
ncbi:MAG: DUF2299 family protein [Nitrososphaeraceae archaeon]